MKIEQKHFDAMMSGQKCKFWDKNDDYSLDGVLRSFDIERAYPFKDKVTGTWFKNCEPIKKEIYLKPLKELLNQIIEDGYKPYDDGSWQDHEWNVPVEMLRDAGKPISEWYKKWSYKPEWVEEK